MKANLKCYQSITASIFYTGEISRVYNKKDLAQILSTNEILASAFMAFAPCSPLLFNGIHFKIGAWTITQHNFVGLFLAMISLLFLIISYFFLQNLTQDETFNDYLKQEIFDDEAEDEEKSEKSAPERLWTTKDIVTNGKVMFLLLTDGYVAFVFSQMDLVITMTAVKNYHWTIMQFGILTAVVVASTSILLYNVQKRLLGNGLNIYFLFVLCFVFIAFSGSFLLLMLVLQWKSFYCQMVTLYISIFCNFLQAFGATAFSRWLVYSSTPSHSASIVESHRFMYHSMWNAAGFFTSSYAFELLWFILPVQTLISIFITVVYIAKRNDYIFY